MARTANAPDPRRADLAARGADVRLHARGAVAARALADVNPLAAALSFSGFLGYVFVYTVWLKRRTPQNIVIGGAAGAVPPLVGWAAVTGSVSGLAVILFFIVFFWTPPHFWALSLLMKDEYGKVGVPMLPVVRGEAETRRQILLYSVLLYAVTQLPFCAGGFGVDLPRRLAAARARLHRRRGAPVPARRPPLGAAAVPVLARLPGAAVLRDGRRRPPIRMPQHVTRRGLRRRYLFAMMTRRLAQKNIRTGLIVCAICMFMFGITFVVAAVYVS